MANEAAQGFQFLYSLLSADATLTALLHDGAQGIVRDVASPGALPEWLVVGHQSGNDVMTMNAVRLMTTHLYRILAVGPETDAANLVAIANRVEALLQPGTPPGPLRNTTSGGVTILACYREQPLALSEIVPGSGSGAAWLNLGGLWRIEM